jgi:hypothetical protein
MPDVKVEVVVLAFDHVGTGYGVLTKENGHIVRRATFDDLASANIWAHLEEWRLLMEGKIL